MSKMYILKCGIVEKNSEIDLFQVNMQCYESDQSEKCDQTVDISSFFTNLFLTAACLTLYSLSLFLSFVISAPIDLSPNSLFDFPLSPFFLY